ncbi:MAG: 30S ribosomal protein S3 [candidate division WOR-3 bacterium]|uniref:Small ribosomal subunit protein uS3 n=1 Tax=candidate division WOR-3 bacterium TaxID=2052148 RepID=A0A7C4S0T5_UNCW3
MGQKTHPYGFRLGITKTWKSQWFDERNYRKYLLEDLKIKDFIKEKYEDALISDIEILRFPERINIFIYTARPGFISGRSGKSKDKLREEILKLIDRKVDVDIDLEGIRVPELDAKIVAFQLARELEKRVAHRRAMKRHISQAMRLGAKGIKIRISGRIAGAEIARSEWLQEGRVPLQTIKADIDYGTDTAFTVYGTIGVKVWIYKGDLETP